MNNPAYGLEKPDRINIEISRTALVRAISSGNIAACELRGLDMQAKQSLWQCCLEACRFEGKC